MVHREEWVTSEEPLLKYPEELVLYKCQQGLETQTPCILITLHII